MVENQQVTGMRGWLVYRLPFRRCPQAGRADVAGSRGITPNGVAKPGSEINDWPSHNHCWAAVR